MQHLGLHALELVEFYTQTLVIGELTASLVLLQVKHDVLFVFLRWLGLAGLFAPHLFPLEFLEALAFCERLLLRGDRHDEVVVAASAVLHFAVVAGVLLFDFEHGLALASVSVDELLLWLRLLGLFLCLLLLPDSLLLRFNLH